MGQYVVRGVPASILQDSWWLEDAAPPPSREGSRNGDKRWQAGAGLALLLALADVLFWEQTPGLSLAVFAGAVFGLVWLLTGRRREMAGPVGVFVLGLLPVVEYVQALSVAFLLGGGVVATCWAVRGGRMDLGEAVNRFVRRFPLLGVRHAIALGQEAVQILRRDGFARSALRGWSFPLAGALILGWLLITANPLLMEMAEDLSFHGIAPDRLMLWTGVGLLVWPFLAVALDAGLLRPHAGPRRPRHLPGLGVNAHSVANSLILFNALLAVQTGLDLTILWGGAELPRGMSHAEYAHRGAYPLLATALLAGGFALAARPFLGHHKVLKPLMYLWLGQNVLLVLSSLLRLSLYVESYGLTYLRVHAGIWMGIVAIGLVLTGWQIARALPNGWLLRRCAGLGLSVLYLCCFVNFAAMIAAENRAHPTRFDAYYTCQLGPMAAAVLLGACDVSAPKPVIRDWREWGFRAHRVIRNLPATDTAGAAHETPRRR